MGMNKGQLFRAKFFLFFVGIFRLMTLGARGVLIDGTKILLIRHTYVDGWQFPGGGVDAGETFESTMRRELVEETGYKVTGGAQLHGIFLNNQVSGRDHVALYLVRGFEQVHHFEPNREIAEIGWFEIDGLPDTITRSARERVAEIFHKAEKSLFW